MTPEEATKAVAPKVRKMTAGQRRRMQLVLRAFSAGVRRMERVRAGELPKTEGLWWPELAPLARHERAMVWKFIGERFGIEIGKPKEKTE
jgi:hypothetical protein